MIQFQNDLELFSHVKQHFYVAAICDILDEMGYRNQAMHQRLRPLLPDMKNCGFVGRARTLKWEETDVIDEDNPYGLEIEAMDSLKEGDVVVHSTDRNGTNAPRGELCRPFQNSRGLRVVYVTVKLGIALKSSK